MVFKRRSKEPWYLRLRESLWPRKGWSRGFRYVGLRIRRLKGTPRDIAAGVACGVFVSFTPFFGLHFFLAAFLAWILRANILASLFGTATGNPVTFPAIAVLCMTLGRRFLGLDHHDEGGASVFDSFGKAVSVILRWGADRLHPLGEHQVSFFEVKVEISALFHNVILPYFLGGLGPGILAAIASYYLLLPIIIAFRKRRDEKIKTVAYRRHLGKSPNE